MCLHRQVARTITNLQQQIQQHQRQLAQALLVKPPPPPPHLSLHPSAGKSAMESFPPHPQAPGLPDLQTKEQQSSPNTFAPYPLGESLWPGPGPRCASGLLREGPQQLSSPSTGCTIHTSGIKSFKAVPAEAASHLLFLVESAACSIPGLLLTLAATVLQSKLHGRV